MPRRPYPSDLTDEQWEYICRNDRFTYGYSTTEARASLREVINAWIYRWETGIPWRMLPHDFPAPSTCAKHHKLWKDDYRLAILRSYMMDSDRFPARRSAKAKQSQVEHAANLADSEAYLTKPR